MKRRWLAIGTAVASGFAVALWITPVPRVPESASSTQFVDRKGHPLRLLLVDERRFAQPCALAGISPNLIAATLSAEDQRFRTHPGIDPLAVARATATALREGRARSGASTITQQLIKLSSPGPRTFLRKLAESWLALRLELAWSKDRVLTAYLNLLDYGNLRTGIAAASHYYFGKPPSDLSVAEAAFLAGLPKAPGRLDPYSNIEAATSRQRHILRRMHADGRIDENTLTRAFAEPLQLRPPEREFEAPHFVDLLLMRKGLVKPEGGNLRTTLDLELNRFVEHCLASQLAGLADRHATGGAVVVLHNPTGEVLALAGSGDYFQPGGGQVNGAWIIRSPGSAVKPFTYLLALERGASPSSIVADVPTSFPTPTGLYRPNNYNHRFYGPVSLRFALGNSLNVAAIRTLELAGGPVALHRALREVGITTLGHPAEHYGLGLTLGNGEVRLLELANAFATLGRLGVYRPFRLLLDDTVLPGRRVFDPNASWLLADMLSDNGARAASFGLRSYLHFDFPVACKTGTSSDYRDNWTVGYTPEFTVAVWVGNPDGSPMRSITGVTGAAPVMHAVFTHLHERRGTSWFAQPPGVRSHAVDPLTGRLAPPGRPGAILDKFLRPPNPARPADYDAVGRVRLPAEYATWIAGPQNRLGNLVTTAASGTSVEILDPPPGSVFFLDADLPGQSLPLRANLPVSWSCDSAPITVEEDVTRLQLAEGHHVIAAHDTAGHSATTWIEVRRW